MRVQTKPRGRGCAGRTLVELVVGAAAAAVLSIAVVALLVAGLRWHRPDESALIRQRAVRDGLDRIVRDGRRATDLVPLEAGLRMIWLRSDGTEEERTYQVVDGSLWLTSDRGTRVVASPISDVAVTLDPIWRYVRVEVRSIDGGRVYRSVSHIMPRAVVR